jgi:drug/metabolite transporter (DMT)-like permease
MISVPEVIFWLQISLLSKRGFLLPDHLGELAALGTSIFYSLTSIVFTFSGREVGSALTNRARLLFAVIFVLVIHWITFGQPLPLNAAPDRWLILALSGLIGFVIGDGCLFQAFLLIGPRISMLMMAFAPALSVLFAWLFLGESLSLPELAIIVVIMAGIAWVVTERPQSVQGADEALPDETTAKRDSRQRLIGLLFGVGATIGQASGFVLSKVGLANDFPAFSGTLIRLLSAFVAVWLVSIVRGELKSSAITLRTHSRALRMILIGSLVGPVLGVWLSLVAVQRTSVGVSSTLSSLAPIILIPISYVVFHEKITRRALIGTLIVIVATCALFLQ